MIDGIREVLDFWFDPSSKVHWFKPDAAFDREVAARLGDLHRRAAGGELEAWQSSAEGCLALCILLDQAPRQLFRGEACAFATDVQALEVAELALAEGFDRALPAEHRVFLYLPLMHSERVRSVASLCSRPRNCATGSAMPSSTPTSFAGLGVFRTAMRRWAGRTPPRRRLIFARAASSSARSCPRPTPTAKRASSVASCPSHRTRRSAAWR
jgi:uncharacterized protein (DUF924 family)